MKVLVAARTPYEERRAKRKLYPQLEEDLVYVPLPCAGARAGAACSCRGEFRVLASYGDSCTVARVREVPDLDRASYVARFGGATWGLWNEWEPCPQGDQVDPCVDALLRVAEALPEATLVERFGSGVRVFHDAPVEDGRYDRWDGTPPNGPLAAFDVLGRIPRALSTTIEHDWLDPETRLPAQLAVPVPARRSKQGGTAR